MYLAVSCNKTTSSLTIEYLCQTHPVHCVVHHIQEQRLLTIIELQICLPDAESSQLCFQLSLVRDPGFVLLLSLLDLGDLT